MDPRARVLIVDDSAFARKVLREVLTRSEKLELVGFARDGLEALERIAETKPDVVTVDLMMPQLDGLGLMRELQRLAEPPRVVVVSFSDQDSEAVAEALAMGALDVVKKPTALATDRMYELSAELSKKVLAAAAARPVRQTASVAPAPAAVVEPKLETKRSLLAIGTSTGGPHALAELLPRLPKGLPVPIVIGLHIPVEYTSALAARLSSASRIEVVEARDGLVLRPGLAVLARGGHHLLVQRSGAELSVRVTREPASALYHPSVDLLFRSAAETCGAGVLGVVLTGMGDDGLIGARQIRNAGGDVLTEAESSCVVYGMPRAVHDAGASTAQAPLSTMADEILRYL